MKQFYEAYRGNEIVTTLLTQISWSNHLAKGLKKWLFPFWKRPLRMGRLEKKATVNDLLTVGSEGKSVIRNFRITGQKDQKNEIK